MARKPVLLTLALVFLLTAAAAATIGVQMGGDTLHCYENDVQVECDPMARAAAEGAFALAGQAILAGAVLLGLLGATAGTFAFRY